MRSEFREPRVRATLGGVRLSGLLSAEIDTNNHFSADQFRVRFAAKAVEQSLLHIPGQQIEIEIGLRDTWTSCFVGLVDHVTYDPILGVVDADGRDLSAQLIETQVDETFTNRTSSEIAVLFGVRHGMLVAADPTTTPIGRYYQSEHDRVALGQFAKTMTEWDLLALLAIREGFDLFMSGRTLRFGLPVTTGASVIRPTDCISLQLGHAIGLSRPIDVVVQIWNSLAGELALGEAIGPGLGPVWKRRITRPNLTSASAQQQAQRAVDDLKRHEWTASLSMPGEFGLTARSAVLLTDTNSAWDRLYHVGRISRRLDTKRGFTQSLSLTGII